MKGSLSDTIANTKDHMLTQDRDKINRERQQRALIPMVAPYCPSRSRELSCQMNQSNSLDFGKPRFPKGVFEASPLLSSPNQDGTALPGPVW
jgi:hypothetical protein